MGVLAWLFDWLVWFKRSYPILKTQKNYPAEVHQISVRFPSSYHVLTTPWLTFGVPLGPCFDLCSPLVPSAHFAGSPLSPDLPLLSRPGSLNLEGDPCFLDIGLHQHCGVHSLCSLFKEAIKAPCMESGQPWFGEHCLPQKGHWVGT